MIDVSIIIVTYNSEAFIPSCLKAIFDHQSNCSYEVIVVDNHSEDATKEICTRYDQVRLIRNDHNAGFAKANNIGIRKALGENILLLNPDVLVKDHCLDQLLQQLDHDPKRAIVAPKLYGADGLTQASARRFPNLAVQLFGKLTCLRFLVGKQYDHYMMSSWDKTSGNVDWVITAVMLMKKSTMVQVGRLDESFFLYCEDIDLCYRLYKKGLSVYYDSTVSLFHDYQRTSSSTLNKSTIIHLQSIFKFYFKHPELIFNKLRKQSQSDQEMNP